MFYKAAKARTDFHVSNWPGPMSEQGQAPKPTAAQVGSWDFKKGLIISHNGTLCAQIAVGTTQRDTKSTQTGASERSVGVV